MILNHEIIEAVAKQAVAGSAPFYLYDTQTIRKQCQLFKRISYPDTTIHFATMANSHPTILKIVKEEGVSVFVNSLIHLSSVKSVGYNPGSIVFTASGLDENTMQKIRDENIQINLDSIGQLNQWETLFGDSPYGIRCNIGEVVKPIKTHAGYFIGKESRLGLTRKEIIGLNGNPRVIGLHLYVGTDILDIDYFIQCYESLCDLICHFPNLEYLNFGGGFGVMENGEKTFSMDEYNLRVTDLLARISQKFNKQFRLILEPGRIITSSSGYFVCRITDVKDRDTKVFIGVNASSVQFPRPLMYPEVARHPVAILRNNHLITDKPTRLSSIFGCSTYSRDFFARDESLPSVQLNDLLVFGNAGAYSASSFSEFLGFPKPDEFFI